MGRQRICKNGVSITLNQEADKWVAKRLSSLGSPYSRRGHTISASWMSRASLDRIVERHRGYGSARIRFIARRNDLIDGREQNLAGRHDLFV